MFGVLDIDPTSSKIQGIPRLANQGRELIKTLLDLNFTDRSTGMNGILSEGKELIRHFGETDCNDLALITSSYHIEAYEIGFYELVIFVAQQYDQTEIVQLMTESLQEEKEMKETLMAIAENDIPLMPSLSNKKHTS